MNDLQKGCRGTVAIKRQSVRQQLIEHYSGGKNVGSSVDRLAVHLLWGHVAQAADELPGTGDGLVTDMAQFQSRRS